MKIYEQAGLPNPRRVEIFLKEKGIEVDRVPVSLGDGEHQSPEFLQKNPNGAVPVLELDDGTYLAETSAICRYFDDVKPGGNLFGTGPKERAVVEMWLRRVEADVQSPVSAYFHHGTEGLGKWEAFQVAAWGQKNKEVALARFARMDGELSARDYVAGDAFTAADIWLLAAMDFATYVGLEIPNSLKNLHAWHARVSARPSVVN